MFAHWWTAAHPSSSQQDLLSWKQNRNQVANVNAGNVKVLCGLVPQPVVNGGAPV